MRIIAVSDLHGHLPAIPDCDILLIGGDLPPTWAHDRHAVKAWMETNLKNWVAELSTRMTVVAVAGNHDFIYENAPEMVPELAWTYLQDSGTEIGGLKIWGSPWQPVFCNWAFNASEPFLKEKWDLIPPGTDIVLLHGPPNGYGDFSPYGKVHTGSPSLTERILEIKPKLVVAGHIHSGYGRYQIGETLFINASLVDEKYRMANKPVEVEL